MESVVEKITPDIATKYLEANVHNRPVHQRHVEFLAEEIKGGRWKMNGSSVVFSNDGTLIDGQHRLWAVITSGVAIRSMVVRGADEGSFATIDTGLARTAGDVLGIVGEKNPANLAAAARFVMAYEGKFITNRKKQANTKVVEMVKKHPGLSQSVEFIRRSKLKIVSKAIAAGLHYLMSKKDAALADEFFTGLAKGFQPESGETFVAIREKLISLLSGSTYAKGPTIAVYLIKAWNAKREGKYLRIFRYAVGEEIPKIR